jgi:hypothetical protein
MLSETQKVVKITGPGSITVINKTAFLLMVIVSVVTPGTLAITIQDIAAPPNTLVPAVDLTPPGSGGSGALVKSWEAPKPVQMLNGINIVTAGTGEAYIWIWFTFSPDPQ